MGASSSKTNKPSPTDEHSSAKSSTDPMPEDADDLMDTASASASGSATSHESAGTTPRPAASSPPPPLPPPPPSNLHPLPTSQSLDPIVQVIPGKKTVEVIQINNPENYEDNTNQTGLSDVEMRIQDSYFSAPTRTRSKAYTDAAEADRARRVAKAQKKADKKDKKKSKKKHNGDQPELVPNTVPWAIENTKKLGILNLSKMDLALFPELVFESMPGTCRIINISFNRITELDTRVCDYVLVQRLIANGNFLSSIPKSICNMTALKKLDLARNKLTALPDAFAGMRFLEHVDLSDNLLNELPPSFSTLELTALNLSRNKFTLAPVEIASMEWLMDLDLSANQLTGIPDEYMSLSRLIGLNLDSNRITDFPNVILQLCDELLTLRLRDNPIRMHILEAKESYPTFNDRRRLKLKRQIDAGTIEEADLLPADN